MWTPTDHWLEITIETLGRWEGWMCSGRAIEKYPLKIFPLCTYGIFFSPSHPPTESGSSFARYVP